MVINLRERVDQAVATAQRNARPFVPSHAQYALLLNQVVRDILAQPLGDIIQTFRGQVRMGTWDVHVLAEVKSAMRIAQGEMTPGTLS